MGVFSQDELDNLVIIERACSIISLLGSAFVIITFCSSRAFHKSINRLVFYASFGNVLCSVGTIMSRSYLDDLTSFGCQAQAFIIQLFVPADSFWALAMAVNVYLTFYCKFDAARLRKMETPYLIACYGVPAIPAFAFLFIKNSNDTHVYGNAVLWCWVGSEWETIRIAALYGPVWVAIAITMFIYIRAGRTIYQQHKQLQRLQNSDLIPFSHLSGDQKAASPIKTTEVMVTRETVDDEAVHTTQLKRIKAPKDSELESNFPDVAYSIHISAEPYQQGDIVILAPMQAHTAQQSSSAKASSQEPANNTRRRHRDPNNAAWAYTKCAVLFFAALLITWIPSSANRLYSHLHAKEASIPLGFMSAFVIPLQGFWNAAIYATTSSTACKGLVTALKKKIRPDSPVMGQGSRGGGIS